LDLVVAAMLATQRHSWEQGVAMQALAAIGRWETLAALAHESIAVSVAEDGRVGVLAGPDAGSATDACACGAGLAKAAALTGDPAFGRALAALEDWALRGAPRRADGIVYHEIAHPRVWVDSVFMLPPFLAATGHFDEAVAQIDGYWRTLRDPASGLLFHMWDEDSGRIEWANLWATGNGWAAAGIAQVAAAAPPGREAERAELSAKLAALAAGMARYQTPAGLFHNFVDRPETFLDAAGGCLLAYAIFLGLSGGWLDRSHAITARRSLTAAASAINRYGFLNPVVGAPDFTRPGVSAEAQAAFILMWTAAADCGEALPAIIPGGAPPPQAQSSRR
jgi:unsaturated rhamnogalacturonyl hydrolase